MIPIEKSEDHLALPPTKTGCFVRGVNETPLGKFRASLEERPSGIGQILGFNGGGKVPGGLSVFNKLIEPADNAPVEVGKRLLIVGGGIFKERLMGQ